MVCRVTEISRCKVNKCLLSLAPKISSDFPSPKVLNARFHCTSNPFFCMHFSWEKLNCPLHLVVFLCSSRLVCPPFVNLSSIVSSLPLFLCPSIPFSTLHFSPSPSFNSSLSNHLSMSYMYIFLSFLQPYFILSLPAFLLLFLPPILPCVCVCVSAPHDNTQFDY